MRRGAKILPGQRPFIDRLLERLGEAGLSENRGDVIAAVLALDLDIAEAPCEIEHRRIGLEDLGHEAAHASRNRKLLEALLEGRAEARALQCGARS